MGTILVTPYVASIAVGATQQFSAAGAYSDSGYGTFGNPTL